MPDHDFDWRALVAIAYRRRGTILLIFASGSALVLLLLFALGPNGSG